MSEPVVLRCPKCNRFLAEVTGTVRVVCPECGSEVSYKSKDARRVLTAEPP